MLANKKVYVGKHSKEIQEKAFKLGYEWRDSGKEVTCLTKPFLYFYDGGKIACGGNIVDFNNHRHNEIGVEEILAMKFSEIKAWKNFDTHILGYKVNKDNKKVVCHRDHSMSPKEVFETDTLPSEEEAKAYHILPTLLWWRDKYNDGWKPDWNDKDYFSIGVDYLGNIEARTDVRSVFTFNTKEILDRFRNDFKDELEIVKPLL